jgi:hypothetical protein
MFFELHEFKLLLNLNNISYVQIQEQDLEVTGSRLYYVEVKLVCGEIKYFRCKNEKEQTKLYNKIYEVVKFFNQTYNSDGAAIKTLIDSLK